MVRVKYVKIDLKSIIEPVKVVAPVSVWKNNKKSSDMYNRVDYRKTLTPFIGKFIDYYEKLFLINTFYSQEIETVKMLELIDEGLELFSLIRLNTLLQRNVDKFFEIRDNDKIKFMVEILRMVIAIEKGFDHHEIKSHNDIVTILQEN
ncbi:MAG: hypothetical protein EOP34_06775 [Rickettsiales bacterium]|nr:MAG: hypothetical protein EOP34_06775 [Rickettsiales bacterium]